VVSLAIQCVNQRQVPSASENIAKKENIIHKKKSGKAATTWTILDFSWL
jgi:hypothetical protein